MKDEASTTKSSLLPKTKKARKEWIDFLRGVAILLVVIGHLIPNEELYFVITSPIKMPLFFAISGYLFVRKGLYDYAKKILTTLVIPWISISMIPVLLQLPFKCSDFVFNYLIDLISGKELWFMPCFIISSCIFYFLLWKIKNRIILGIFSFCIFFIGIYFKKNHILDFSMVNIALTVQPFFYAGYLFKVYESEISNYSYLKSISIVMIIVYSALVSCNLYLYPDMSIDIHTAHYFNIPLCIMLIIVGLFSLFTIFSNYNGYPKSILVIGKHSFVIYIYHYYVIIVIDKILGLISFNIPIIAYVLIAVFFICVLCVMISKFYSRYLPFVVGYR